MKNEFEKPAADNVRAENGQQVMGSGVQPSVLLENISDRKLFSTVQIGVASFLGAPISGCLLIAKNNRALGKVRSAWLPLVVGVAATIFLLLLALFLPDGFPNFVLPAAGGLAVYSYAKQQEGDAIDNYLKAGGRKGSWWVVIGVSLVCAVISAILLIAIAIAFDLAPPEDEKSQPVTKVSVYFSPARG